MVFFFIFNKTTRGGHEGHKRGNRGIFYTLVPLGVPCFWQDHLTQSRAIAGAARLKKKTKLYHSLVNEDSLTILNTSLIVVLSVFNCEGVIWCGPTVGEEKYVIVDCMNYGLNE